MQRIGIDARPLQGETKHRGIGKTLENLIISLRQIDKQNSYIYYIDTKETKPDILLELNNNEKIISVSSKAIRRAKYFRSVLKSFKPITPKSKDIDIFIQPDASLGVPSNIPTIVIFYDLIPLLFRRQEKERAKKSKSRKKSILANEAYWRKYKKDLKRYKKANKILAISKASKNDLLKYMPEIDDSIVDVMHLGVNQSILKSRASKEVAKKKPYILYVGGIDYRKNIRSLLIDFFNLKNTHSDLKLVLIGKEFGLNDQLRDLGWDEIMNKNKKWSKDVIRPGFISEDDLNSYYANACAFIFPSVYEGFGLPILEAMSKGCPVIAYNNSSIPEVAGDAAILVDDGRPLDTYMAKLLDSDKLRNKYIEKGLERVELFSWEKSAKTLLRSIEEVANG
jgi:glycosyltransferase involved in cell wall biosynthesis